ncbi:MAG: response regulator transcription factor [Candidatus Moranbacteria bacterium]|nr:response regulator transcription factor [Candidatus Moranbacteria bacterium]
MKILVVEDNKKLAKSLKKGLEQEGYAADYLTDGEAGQRRLEIGLRDYDLVVLDLMLPKRDGIAVCKNWRDQNIMTPVIMLTAKDADEDKIFGLDSGADDYLIKPFSFPELLARIRALLRRPKTTLPSELKIKDLVLNISTRKVFRGQREVHLTLKEFAILEYLVRQPNQVLNREQIISHVWDFAFDSFSNLVDVHIKNLRKKLEKKNDEKILETIRGIGYRIKS